MFKGYSSYIGKYKKQTILSPVFLVLETIIEVITPLVMAILLDEGITKGDSRLILIAGGGLIALAIIGLFFGVKSTKNAAIASCGFSKNLAKGMYDRIQDFSFKNIDKYSSASLVTRLTYDMKNMENAFRVIIRTLVRAPLLLTFSIIMAFIINARLALIFLVTTPILVVGLSLIILKAFPLFQKMFVQYDAVEEKVQENLAGIRVVKSFVQEDREIVEFEREAEKLKRLAKAAEKLVAFNVPLMSIVTSACLVAILWFGGNMIILDTFKPGELVAFINYTTQIIMSLMMLSMTMVTLGISKASSIRIKEVMQEKIDLEDTGLIDKAPENGCVEFENVFFKYDPKTTNFVLSDINLKIKSGETIGIVGGTGAAKTSLLQLIPRLYDVDVGEVKVAGVNVKDYKLQTLRDSVAMVLQKNVLFSGTIKENLLWGNKNASDKELQDACKAAMAHDFIMGFKDGYETDLSQGGVNLSGGQKQRICIARALLKKPEIMILDDSTSAVDVATENNLKQSFEKHFKDTTLIIVAQRINSVMHADRIIVLDEGKINGIGAHEELLASNEIYKEIYDIQESSNIGGGN